MSAPGTVPITVDANGNGNATISHNKTGFYWDIKQLSVGVSVTTSGNILMASGIVCSVQLVYNGQPCTSLVTGRTPLTASGDPSMKIGDHDVLTVVVSNAPPNQALICSYYYDEIQGQP